MPNPGGGGETQCSPTILPLSRHFSCLQWRPLKMSESLTSSTFKLLCKRKPMCSFSQDHLLLYLTLQYLPKDFCDFCPKWKESQPQADKPGGMGAGKTFPEISGNHIELYFRGASHLQPVLPIYVPPLIFYLAFSSLLINLKIEYNRK